MVPPQVPPPSPEPSPALRGALRRLLRPLVRLLIEHQITLPVLSGLLKEVYVEVAEREFQLADRPPTTTRVSLLTGVHRKDARRLRESPAAAPLPEGRAPLGAQIVSRWTSEAPWLDAGGRPRALPRRGAGPDDPSFESLVAGLSSDLRPRTVLDEWLRLGIAELDTEDRVHLRTEAFVPASGLEEKAYFFGRNLRDHIAAGAHNLRGDKPAFPDRAVYYDALSEHSVQELAELSEKLGMDAIRAVNRRARALERRDARRDEPRHRMTLGFYFYRAPTRQNDEGEDDDA